jgi:hypothetical protein
MSLHRDAIMKAAIIETRVRRDYDAGLSRRSSRSGLTFWDDLVPCLRSYAPVQAAIFKPQWSIGPVRTDAQRNC